MMTLSGKAAFLRLALNRSMKINTNTIRCAGEAQSQNRSLLRGVWRQAEAAAARTPAQSSARR